MDFLLFCTASKNLKGTSLNLNVRGDDDMNKLTRRNLMRTSSSLRRDR